MTPATRSTDPMSRNPSASTTTMTTVEAQLATAAAMIASGSVTRSGWNAGTLHLGGPLSNYGSPPAGTVASILATHNQQTDNLLGQLLSPSSDRMTFQDAFEEYWSLKRCIDEVGENTDDGQRLKRRCHYLETVMDDTEKSGHTFSRSTATEQQPTNENTDNSSTVQQQGRNDDESAH